MSQTKKNNKKPNQEKAVVYKDDSDNRYRIKYPDGTIDLINRAHNISPLDSKYKDLILEMVELFSDFNLVRAKVMVEVDYFKYLYENRIGEFKDIKHSLVEDDIDLLNDIYMNFSDDDYNIIKEKEKDTHHDIKAIEYFVRDRLKEHDVEDKWLEYVHFGLTSQDIVSLSNAKILDACMGILGSKFLLFMNELNDFSVKHNDKVIVGRTHGKPAIPTSIGREITVFTYRLQQIMDRIGSMEIKCKFGGAVGNMMAMYDSLPEEDWDNLLNQFVMDMGLQRSLVTTQTDNYDSFCTIFDSIRSLCNILIDFCRDMWMYISRDYFIIKTGKKQVGSSTMPQKVNPIKFENAEGNLEIAVMWFGFLSDKLRKSRLQRDLSDSTVIRNIGIPFGHFQLAISNISRGIKQLDVNEDVINEELQNSYFILAEAVQTRLRKNGYSMAYDEARKLFQGIIKMNRKQYHATISKIKDIPYEFREELFDLKPEDYYRG